MATHPSVTSGVNVSDEFNALRARLDGVSRTLRDNAEANEARCELTDDVARVLRDTGALKVGIPRELGGYEFSPRQLIDTIARISYEEASTGWTFMALQAITGTTAAYLGADAARELFPDVHNDRYALVAGHGTTLGRAVRVDAGYRITGHWHLASGISLASHIHTAARCEETGRALAFTLPKERATLVDNWDVMGLRATRSVDYTCDDVFVPDRYAYEITTMGPGNGGAIYRMGLATMSGVCHTGWALGVGRRILDEMRDLATTMSGTPNAAMDTDQFHAEYAVAESKLRAARAWATEVWTDNEATLDRGERLSTEQETLTRLMLHNTASCARDAGATAHKWAATAAIRRGPLQRFIRDLHVGAQLVTSGPVVLQNCGRWLSGLAPNANWVFLDLDQRR